jgi:hypothetical protein
MKRWKRRTMRREDEDETSLDDREHLSPPWVWTIPMAKATLASEVWACVGLAVRSGERGTVI